MNINTDLQAGICFGEACRGLQKGEKYRKAEYVQRRVCFVYLQSSLQENVVFSVCVRMGNAAYFIFS